MWKYKKWDDKKKPKYEEEKAQVTGVHCEYCSELPELKCENCGVEMCKNHSGEIKTRYPPYYKTYCSKCKKRHYVIRGLSVGATIAVFLGFAIYQSMNPPAT